MDVDVRMFIFLGFRKQILKTESSLSTHLTATNMYLKYGADETIEKISTVYTWKAIKELL